MDVRKVAHQLADAGPDERDALLAEVCSNAPAVGSADEMRGLDQYTSSLGAVLRRLRRHHAPSEVIHHLEEEIQRNQARRDHLVLERFDDVDRRADAVLSDPLDLRGEVIELLGEAGTRLGLHVARADDGVDVTWSWMPPVPVVGFDAPTVVAGFVVIGADATETQVKAALYELSVGGAARSVLVDITDHPGAATDAAGADIAASFATTLSLAQRRRATLATLTTGDGRPVVVWSAQDVVRVHTAAPDATLVDEDIFPAG